jgi:hypothetical protein
MNDETYPMDMREFNDNAVAEETFLQVSLSRHATRRADGWLHSSRAPAGLPLAGESSCAADL